MMFYIYLIFAIINFFIIGMKLGNKKKPMILNVIFAVYWSACAITMYLGR